MGEKMRRFKKSLVITLKNFGSATEKVLGNLEKQDREINEKMKRAMGSAGNID